MRRATRILVIVWHFLVLPSLCQAGVLGHRCPEDASALCSHEEACSADPCSTSDETLSKGTTRNEDAVDAAVALSATGTPADAARERPTGLNAHLRAHAVTRVPLRAFPLRN